MTDLLFPATILLKFTSVILIGEVQKRGLHVRKCPVFVKISVKNKKTCLQAYNFDNGVTLPTEESHITPRGEITPRLGTTDIADELGFAKFVMQMLVISVTLACTFRIHYKASSCGNRQKNFLIYRIVPVRKYSLLTIVAL